MFSFEERSVPLLHRKMPVLIASDVFSDFVEKRGQLADRFGIL